MRPIILDLFCGEGGASAGYDRSGFYLVGVDLNDDWTDRRTRPRPLPLRRYPYASLQGDALEVLDALLAGGTLRFSGFPPKTKIRAQDIAVVHASPPCQAFSSITRVYKRPDDYEHPDLIDELRSRLEALGKPYVIENVPEAPLREPSLLCGSMFNPPLDVRRHRHFETNWPLETPAMCRHELWQPRFRSADRRSKSLARGVPVYGGTRFPGDADLRRRVMEMPWASAVGCTQGIPPAYTELIGKQLIEVVR